MRLTLTKIFFRITAMRHKRLFPVPLIALCLLPAPARAQGVSDIISLIETITSTLRNAIGGTLAEIQSVRADINNFRQQMIWPVTQINQAKSLAASMRSQYGGLTAQIFAIKNSSATLVNPSQLESAVRSSQPTSVGELQSAYTAVYSPVSPAADAQPIQRNLMDIDDALAAGSLKTAILSDETTQRMLSIADSMEQQSGSAAPGSAAILSAQGQVASLEAQALEMKLLAAELREEATRLAHNNASLKQNSQAMQNLVNQFQQVLSRQ